MTTNGGNDVFAADTLRRAIARALDDHRDDTAIRYGDKDVSYRELAERVRVFRHGLAELGIDKGSRLVLRIPKSDDLVALMIACLRSGIVYVPAPSTWPDTRVDSVIRLSGAVAVVNDDAPGGPRPGEGGSSFLETTCGSIGNAGSSTIRTGRELHDPELGADDVAYLLFTSGSTGDPKGVTITDANAWAFVKWSATSAGLVPEDVVIGNAPFSFDLSVFDVYSTLVSGAILDLVPELVSSLPTELGEFVRERKGTVLYTTPSVIQLLGGPDHDGFASLGGLRALILAGEEFPNTLATRLRAALLETRLFNWYGPTETNVCLGYEIDATVPVDADCESGLVPLGSAASEAEIVTEMVEDQGLELIVRGPTVTPGYWGSPRSGGVHRTGDIVSRDRDGLYHFVGRRDSQAKLRGYRIELGEVERAAQSMPGISAAAAFVDGKGAEGRLCLACTVETGADEPTLVGLNGWLARSLPAYIRVDRFYVRDHLPLNDNGKTDRRALVRELTR